MHMLHDMHMHMHMACTCYMTCTCCSILHGLSFWGISADVPAGFLTSCNDNVPNFATEVYLPSMLAIS